MESIAVIVEVTLSWLASNCAPRVNPNTTLAVISVESGGHPWEIDDDTARRSYYPKSKDEAVRIASDLIAENHNLDMGLMQVNSIHLDEYGKTVEQLFDPCTNVTVGSDILYRAYHTALHYYPAGGQALFHAFQIYNSNRANGSPRYAELVWSEGNKLAAGIR